MGQLPKAADFPSSTKLNIVPPPQNDAPTNILILLHGLGDTYASFTVLAGQLNLPETACLSIQAPATLLDLGGFHWGDDIIFDSTNGGLDFDAGFTNSTKLLRSVVQDVLIEKCGYQPREILLFGFGQGGMAALNYVASSSSSDSPRDLELGGVVSIGAPLPSEAPASLDPKSKTPVLVCAGTNQSSVTSASEDKLRRVFANVEVKRFRRPGDHMPNSREEMLPIMQFFARRLRSVKGVPGGAVEVG